MALDAQKKRQLGSLLVGMVALLLGVFLVRLACGRSSSEVRAAAASVAALDAGTADTALEGFLERCRRSAAGDGGSPSWAQALADCEAVMRISLGHPEAAALAAAIRPQVECDAELARARALRASGDEQGATFALKGIVFPCANAALARREEARLVPELKQSAAADCQKFSAQKNWRDAFAACERYVDLTHCPGFESRVSPPPGRVLDVWGTRGNKGWKPEDPLLTAFVQATQQAHKKKVWRCGTHFAVQKR